MIILRGKGGGLQHTGVSNANRIFNDHSEGSLSETDKKIGISALSTCMLCFNGESELELHERLSCRAHVSYKT